ncbi:PREDICTED: uncharacterized protein LOC105449469 [Wasmannia auropunctata]|uniref:uncharacterized protein LOC105449469 n=1 Tax=Wasmannia auropunctata TaxID=64793 RepID=UPI0005ED9ECD|nr:PREDICTED: uncharacterized protein LOC105449469 [Wasmannia auropunctata]
MVEICDRAIRQARDETGDDDSSRSNCSHKETSRALPKIALPKFAGEYHAWLTFRDLFKSMVSLNPDIRPVEKLHYLKTHISGDAARLISNFTITADNYASAWGALCARYDNKRLLVHSGSPVRGRYAHERPPV